MLFEANEKHSLLRIAYTRQNCYFCLWEDYFKRTLYLLAAIGGDMASSSDLRFDIDYLEDGKPVRYHYFGDEGSLTLRTRTAGKWSELLLTGDDFLRFRGERNTGLRLTLNSNLPGHGAIALHSAVRLPDGSVEAVMGKYGRFRFAPIRGKVEYRAEYDCEQGRYARFEVDMLPDENGCYECDVISYEGERRPAVDKRSFAELREENLRSFAEFFGKYKRLPDPWKKTEEELVYTVWCHVMKPRGFLKVPMVMMHHNALSVAMAWQQSFNACAMLGDPKTAFDLIEAMFLYQNPVNGALPVNVCPGSISDGNSQPPLQGYALDFVTKMCGEEFITREMAERLLPRFERVVEYWTTFRNVGRGDDLAYVLNPTEAGMDDASIFAKGFPAVSGDIQTLLIECMYACAILSRRAGDAAKAEAWTARADRLLDALITELWDGDKFVTKKLDGEVVESLSLACYVPVMLGDRLPKEITRRIAEKLLEEGEFMTPYGLASESTRSPLAHWGWHFTLGRVVSESNMFCVLGLWLAGEKEAAKKIADAWCGNVAERGPRLGFTPAHHYPLTGEPTDIVLMPHIGDGWSWTSWSACGTLAMLETVYA